jgi:hypothetical protein
MGPDEYSIVPTQFSMLAVSEDGIVHFVVKSSPSDMSSRLRTTPFAQERL